MGIDHTIVLINEIETTVIWHETCYPAISSLQLWRLLLSVLDELDTDTFSYGRVGLFGLDTDFLQHNSLTVGSTLERRRFPCSAESTFAEVFIGPSVLTAVDSKLARCVETRGLSFTHVGDVVVESDGLSGL